MCSFERKFLMRRILLTSILLAVTIPVLAGKYNPTLSIGDPAPEWKDLTGVDGMHHSPPDAETARVIVLAFTCNTCPYAVDYEDRLVALAKTFEKQPVQLIAINSNSGKADELKAMQTRAEQKRFTFPYLKDDDAGAVGKAFGATRTPEFVVLDEQRKVVYLGALDDDPDGKNIERRYVEEAVRAILDGHAPEITETPPIGCAVKYPRIRRRAGS